MLGHRVEALQNLVDGGEIALVTLTGNAGAAIAHPYETMTARRRVR